ncbi:hypothetical protein Hhel01_02535 [Haloferula helveola]
MASAILGHSARANAECGGRLADLFPRWFPEEETTDRHGVSGTRAKVVGGHAVDARSALVGLHAFPRCGQVLRVEDLLDHGSCLGVSMLPAAAALVHASPSGVVGWGVRHGVETLLIGSVLHRLRPPAALLRFITLRLVLRLLRPPSFAKATADRLLTSHCPATVRSPQVMARCSAALPPHLPPRAYQTPSVCCATSTRRVGLLCGSCPSTHSFPIAFLHASGRPRALGLW